MSSDYPLQAGDVWADFTGREWEVLWVSNDAELKTASGAKSVNDPKDGAPIEWWSGMQMVLLVSRKGGVK